MALHFSFVNYASPVEWHDPALGCERTVSGARPLQTTGNSCYKKDPDLISHFLFLLFETLASNGEVFEWMDLGCFSFGSLFSLDFV